MSFNSDVKDELARVAPTCSHCERALLAAIVRVEGTLIMASAGRYRLEIATDSPAVARLSLKLLHETYGVATELTMRHSVLHKNLNYLISVPAQEGLAAALEDMGVLENGSLKLGVKPSIVSKQCCAAAYLRGVFLGSGFVADPKGDFHFEMTVENHELAQDLVGLMVSKGINARMMKRRSSFVVYLKSGESISEFLAFVGAHQSALDMEAERVVKSVRNDVNRMINAELANESKAAIASADQIFAMTQVVEKLGMANLPPALQEIIRLRAAYPEASLKELGEHASPPLSKSAVYHRVRRIEEMARDLAR